MNILCKMFGHKPLTRSGHAGGVAYAGVSANQVDGVNTWHLTLRAKCPRCEERYDICKVHVPSNTPAGWPTPVPETKKGGA